jgi:hypothetical protein
MTERLQELLDKASTRTMTDAERSQQRESFAYGNTKIENDHVTRDMVRSEAVKKKDRHVVEE